MSDDIEQDLAKNRDRNEPVVRFKTPEELKAIINFPIPKEGTGLKGNFFLFNWLK
jgi:hypothetical protein